MSSVLAQTEDPEKKRELKAAAEAYLRMGCQQAQGKRDIQQVAVEDTLGKFVDAQGKGFKIIGKRAANEVLSRGEGGFGTVVGPIGMREEKGKQIAEFGSREDRDAWVDQRYKIYLEKAKRLNGLPTWEPPILDLRYAKLGDCGELVSEIDDSPFVVEGNSDLPYFRRELATIEIIQIVDKQTFLGNVNGVDALIEGVETTTLTDGKKLRIPSIALLHSTKQYTTVLGASRTVFVLKLASSESEKKIREFAKTKTPPRIEFGHSRKWKSSKDEVLETGFFRRKDTKSVIVVVADGSEKSIDIATLSAQDRQYLKDIARLR